MKVGYARVSTDEQSVDLQVQALQRAGCDLVFTDRGVSGAVFERQGLSQAMRRLRKGDTLVVWKLDRLGRSLSSLVRIVSTLGRRNVQFSSLSECIDTGTAGGVLIFHLMGALAEFERALISERTKAGMAAAKRRGSPVGRPKALSSEQIDELYLLASVPEIDLQRLAAHFQVHPRTVRRYLDALSSI
ncbi:recombinase family protein [Pseudacidovorax sp. RU35E]|jgi:DNA invertase Pin-like site-specific DNA recombinase|uniref:recombinase family protein n=1 Tax=Pseudacidovorax sp. RU35E TaxID=1907403 RepID=UPI000971389A|nr:recombinase family protein [Pseudacidovorax sp. RU35E]